MRFPAISETDHKHLQLIADGLMPAMRLWCSGSTADFTITFFRRKAWVRTPPASLVRRVARWSERRPYKTMVEGSIPSTPTRGIKRQPGIVADKAMLRTLNPADVGSTPTDPTE